MCKFQNYRLLIVWGNKKQKKKNTVPPPSISLPSFAVPLRGSVAPAFFNDPLCQREWDTPECQPKRETTRDRNRRSKKQDGGSFKAFATDAKIGLKSRENGRNVGGYRLKLVFWDLEKQKVFLVFWPSLLVIFGQILSHFFCEHVKNTKCFPTSRISQPLMGRGVMTKV